MANPLGADSSGGGVGLTVTRIDDLLAMGGIGEKGQKELSVNPDMLTAGAPSSCKPERSQPAEQYGHEATGVPDSQSSGVARIDEGDNKGHASGSSFQPALAKRTNC